MMVALITAYRSDGSVIGRCDARCYDALSDECDCICGGANHGAGRAKAMDNTRELAESWMQRYAEQHPVDHFFIPEPLRQFELPGFES